MRALFLVLLLVDLQLVGSFLRPLARVARWRGEALLASRLPARVRSLHSPLVNSRGSAWRPLPPAPFRRLVSKRARYFIPRRSTEQKISAPFSSGDRSDDVVDKLLTRWVVDLTDAFSTSTSFYDTSLHSETLLSSAVVAAASAANRMYSEWQHVLGADVIAKCVLRALLRPPQTRFHLSMENHLKKKSSCGLKFESLAQDLGKSLAGSAERVTDVNEAGTVPSSLLNNNNFTKNTIYSRIGKLLLLQAIPLLHLDDSQVSSSFSLIDLKVGNESVPYIKRDRDMLYQILAGNRKRFPWLQHAYFLPQHQPPAPWTSVSNKGTPSNLSLSSPQNQDGCNLCVKVQEGSLQHKLLMQDDQQGKLQGLYDGLNTLSQTAWTINERILDVARYIELKADSCHNNNTQPFTQNANSSENSATNTLDQLDKFLMPSSPVLPYRNKSYFTSQADYKSYLNSYYLSRDEYYATSSKNVEIRQILRMAEELTDKGPNDTMPLEKITEQEPFFYPYAADFRGRAYPMVPYLNPTGSGLARGLLKFHEKRRLGQSGLFWLKIQLANSYGWGKLSLNERIRMVNENMHNILVSAADPLADVVTSSSGAILGGWWRTAEHPWICLAACFELAGALQFVDSGGRYQDYESSLPVMLDGSCNGLQHYSALGLDEAGGVKRCMHC